MSSAETTSLPETALPYRSSRPSVNWLPELM